MGQCVASIKSGIPCGQTTQPGYKFCEEHKGRPKGIQEREEKGLSSVIDATQVFEGVVEEKKDYSNVAIPREQQSIYQKANGSLDKALDWEEMSWQQVKNLHDEWRYQDKNGVEQLRSEVSVYERAQDRVIRAVTAMAKLDIEAQSVNVNKLLKEMIKGVVMRVFQRMELDSQQIELARQYLADEFEKLDQERKTG